MTRRRLIRVAVIVALAATPAGALAASPSAHAATKTPPKPKVGAWQIVTNGYSSELQGGFTITHSHYVTAFQGTIQSGAETACGTGTISIAGKHKIIDAKGTDDEGGNYNEWAVGKNNEDADPVIEPIKVSVTTGGQTIRGELWLVFAPPAAGKDGGLSGGELEWSSGNCDLQFDIQQG